MAADQDQIDQQKRVVLSTRTHVAALLAQLGTLDDDLKAYTNLGLGDDSILDDAAFIGTGTNRADYRAAIVSLQAIDALLKEGHAVNLSKFAL